MKRRDFFKVLGASGAVVGCTTNRIERLIPYVVPSEEIVPGVPTWYATTCRECPAGCGLLVETHEGRATKVEGNPQHPISRGNVCARGQAAVQGLYHPDRYRGPQIVEPGVEAREVSWAVAEAQLVQRLQEARAQGRAIVLLTAPRTGLMDRLFEEWAQAVGAERIVYEPLPAGPRGLDLANAELIVSFGADFLETYGSPVEYAYQFARMHAVAEGRRGTFVWIGPHRPLTGLNADAWLAPRPGTEAVLAAALAGDVEPAQAAAQTGLPAEEIARWAREVATRRTVVLGPGAALAGPYAPALRRAVDALRARVGGVVGETYGGGPDVAALAERMRRGEVGVLLVDGELDPLYSLPAALRFAEGWERVPVRVSFATFPTDTAESATLRLPAPHFLEAWDEVETAPGVVGLVQPVMRPLYNTKHTGDVLLSVAAQLGVALPSAGGAATFYDALRRAWTVRVGGEEGWREAVRVGGLYPRVADLRPEDASATGLDSGALGTAAAAAPSVAGSAGAPVRRNPQPADPAAIPAPEGADFHVVVYPSYRFYDGRTANRPWLLELPDPVTKVIWESWAELHPATARRLGIDQGDTIEIATAFGRLQTYAYVWPGVRPDVVALPMGLGHRAMGRWTANLGANPNVLLPPVADDTGHFGAYGVRARVRKVSDKERLIPGLPPRSIFEQGVRVQYNRELAQAMSLAELRQAEARGDAAVPGERERVTTIRGNGGFTPATEPTDPASYPPRGTKIGEYVEEAPRWAMVVDLDKCIGCGACVVACYAENNIPVVGPIQMRKGREMAWLRIERYFHPGDQPEAALADGATDDVRFLPVMCQHCGNAPCEPVCPVYAAYHTPDGLNGQAYTRCVGTRYCANNCPWKVRVFNWFTYDFPAPMHLQLNPDVTVREKGVMEKCTFCVQRIREGQRRAHQEGRPVRDGDIVPACAQTCPTDAIVFGNIADPTSAVAKAARSPRAYRTFETLNTQPAVVYLRKVTLREPVRGGHHAGAHAEE